MTGRLKWICDICHRPISDHKGYVTIDLIAVRRYERDNAEWEAGIRAENHGWLVIHGQAWTTMPHSPPWQVLHGRCDPNPDSYDYWIDVSRARSVVDVLDWTIHLLGKTWFPATPWPALIRRHVLAKTDA